MAKGRQRLREEQVRQNKRNDIGRTEEEQLWYDGRTGRQRLGCQMTHVKWECLRRKKENGETKNCTHIIESVHLEEQNSGITSGQNLGKLAVRIKRAGSGSCPAADCGTKYLQTELPAC
jgi:hypothetical protein